MITATATGKVQRVYDNRDAQGKAVVDLQMKDFVFDGERRPRDFWLRLPDTQKDFANKCAKEQWTVIALCYSVEAINQGDSEENLTPLIVLRSNRLDLP